MNTLSSLLKFIGNLFVGQSEYGSSGYASNITLIACTGTLGGSIAFYKSKSGIVTISARINIDSFVRTGANAGVEFTLPSIVPTPTRTGNYFVGFRGQNPREMVVLNTTAGSRTATLSTTETYQNAQNGNLTLVACCPITL